MERLSAVDLFCGAGGMSIGLESTGLFRAAAACDADPDSAAAYAANHSDALMLGSDVRRLDPSEAADVLGIAVGGLGVLAAGPPCQGFSRNRARRGGEADPRNTLLWEAVRWAEALRPAAVLIENVPDMLSASSGSVAEQLIAGLGRAGYEHVECRVLNAADFGAAQRRRRAFVLAGRDGPIRLPAATHQPCSGEQGALVPSERWATVADAIGDLPSLAAGEGRSPSPYASDPACSLQKMLRGGAVTVADHVAWPLSDVQSDRLACLGPGDGAESLPGHLAVNAQYGGAYRRLRWDEPALTVTTWLHHPGSGAYYHPSDHRTITLREAARLQSFPDRAVFRGSKQSRCRQVGNAVPPLVAAAIGREIHRAVA